MQSPRAYLEGNIGECLRAIETGEPLARKDPECLYYMARHLARINEPERAIRILRGVIEGGFVCFSALARDPWMESLRSLPEYLQLLQFAEQRRSQMHASFVQAGGHELLG